MQQDTLRVPAPLRFEPSAVRGIPRGWHAPLAEIDALARRTDREVLGLLWGSGPNYELEVVRNVSGDPTRCFEGLGSLPDRVAGVVHTHPAGTAWPSFRDQAQQLAGGVPWGIAPRGGEPFVWGDGIEAAHLIHRPFRWGVTDCWGAVRDGLAVLYGMTVGNYPREWQFWREGPVFERHTIAEGFRHVSSDVADANEGDVVLMRIRSDVYNHAALCVGAGMIYHHPSAHAPFDETIPARLEALDRYCRMPSGVFSRG